MEDGKVDSIVCVRYWDVKFIVLNLIIVLLLAIVAYFEFYYYPSIMAGSNYGESNLTLVLGLLTYRYDFNRCSMSCPGPRLTGVPALDFFQLLLIVLVVSHVTHYWSYRRRPELRVAPN